MISMEMIKSFSYLHRTLIACLFLRVTHTKIRRMRKRVVSHSVFFGPLVASFWGF